jgi:hypothetical protein
MNNKKLFQGMQLLELFKGTGSVGKAGKQIGFTCFFILLFVMVKNIK